MIENKNNINYSGFNDAKSFDLYLVDCETDFRDEEICKLNNNNKILVGGLNEYLKISDGSKSKNIKIEIEKTINNTHSIIKNIIVYDNKENHFYLKFIENRIVLTKQSQSLNLIFHKL